MNATTDAVKAGVTKGMVVNIQHFCTQDGPGMRCTVFLKFCSLRCKWCSNPETIARMPELAYNSNKCIGKKACGRCMMPPAPPGAMFVVDGPDDKIQVNWDLAGGCGEETASLCPTGALYLFGHEMTVDEVLAEVEQDQAFFAESGGGITVSGGECMLSPDFTAALLAEAHKRGFNTAVETASNVPYENIAKVAPHVDYYYHDIKNMDSEAHKKWSGIDNKRILENLKRVYDEHPNTKFIARTPVIPGVNDSVENVKATLEFIRPHRNVIKYELLPYHRFGESKYSFLGKKYELEDFPSLADETLSKLRGLIDEAFGRKGWSEVSNPLTAADPGASPNS
jgi:pyruvate formate lyase activating enzyme